MRKSLAVLFVLGWLGSAASAQETGKVAAASSFTGTAQDCTEIAAVPVTITVPGQYCLKRDLQTSITSDAAIRIEADFVTVNLNGFKLGGLGGGPSTYATGIYAYGYRQVTIRNGTIRGFRNSISIVATGDGSTTSGHIVENVRSENARSVGIYVDGWRSVVRDNFIVNTLDSAANSMIGLRVGYSRGSHISGNVISGVQAQTAAFGIFLSEVDGVIVEGNKVYDIVASFSRGIYSSHTARVIAKDNVMANRGMGSQAIVLDSTNDVCLDNMVTGFSTLSTGCESEDGNGLF